VAVQRQDLPGPPGKSAARETNSHDHSLEVRNAIHLLLGALSPEERRIELGLARPGRHPLKFGESVNDRTLLEYSTRKTTLKQIAKQENLSLDAVKQRLRRGRRRKEAEGYV
jgi:hypothetical protein